MFPRQVKPSRPSWPLANDFFWFLFFGKQTINVKNVAKVEEKGRQRLWQFRTKAGIDAQEHLLALEKQVTSKYNLEQELQ